MISFFILVFNLLFALTVFAQTPLQNCKDESCLRTIVPYNSKSPPPLESCKVLDGKKSPGDFDEDLGVLCRLVISRAMAGQRSVEACSAKEGDPNPDWEMGLDQKALLQYYNKSLREASLGKKGVGALSGTSGTNNSTLHGTYVYDHQSREEAGANREVSFATYFCITASPQKRYTPYFSVLKIAGKPVEQNPITNPPKAEPVLFQLPKTDFNTTYEFSDLNGDGNKDIVILDRDIFEGFGLSVCLYKSGQASCQEIKSPDFIKVDEMFAKGKLEIKSPREIKVQFSKDGKVLSNAVYEYSGNNLKLLKK